MRLIDSPGKALSKARRVLKPQDKLVAPCYCHAEGFKTASGSTQATIWTLRALLLAASKGTDGAVGSLDVAVDNAAFTTLALTADQADVMTTVDLSTLATTGKHDVTLTFVGTGKVYPAYLSPLVDGMDALLRVPSGCFEQTTSTAWPDVLVTAYFKQTKQLKPEIQLKAESLMSAGYQRLLTFEHAGGGYSWFGEQDPAPYLSAGRRELAELTGASAGGFPDAEKTRSKGLGSAEGEFERG
ncbi:MAG TPA: hypothetical protein VJ860_06855 [Polyangia bacterium]|nr:hypothetical protein [Polyangia bacterium]